MTFSSIHAPARESVLAFKLVTIHDIVKGADMKRSTGVGSRFTWVDVWSVALGGEWLSLVIFGSIVGRCMGWVVFSLSYHANAASDLVLVWGLMNPGSERWWVACALCNALVRRVFNALAPHPWSCSQGSPGGSGVSVCRAAVVQSCVYSATPPLRKCHFVPKGLFS